MHNKRKMLGILLIITVATGISLALVSVAMATADVTNPVVTSVTPANGSTIFTNGGSTVYYQSGNSTPMVIKADYSDEVGGSGVDPANVMVHLDGENMLFDCPVQTASHVECNATAADLYPGSHTLDVYVMDYAGNLTVNPTTFNVVVDNAVPTYSNLSPTNGSTIYTSQLNSTSTNDPSALRFDYDLTDAAPSSGYSPMSHVNDTSPPSVTGAMIMGCTKTPTTNPTHYSCQANRAGLLHLGDNTLRVFLKDKVGNSNYSDPASNENHYTVVDDVVPAVSVTTDGITITATYSDPQPTGALSTNLASGIDLATNPPMIHLDGICLDDIEVCTTSATTMSCPVPGGLAPGDHPIEAMANDVAGNAGDGTGTLTIDPPPCSTAKPDLSLSSPEPFWGSYADYTDGTLSVTWTVNNIGTAPAANVMFTGSEPSPGVSLITAMPAAIGNIAVANSGIVVLQYHVPSGLLGFHVAMTGSAQNECATDTYTYPV